MEALAEKFLEKVAKSKGVDKPTAAKLINKCISLAAATLNLDYSIIYAEVYSEEYMAFCLRKMKCSEHTINECRKSCFCVEFDDKCISRRIPKSNLINKDPDKYVKDYIKTTKDLESLVKIASFLYYNYDGGGLTDNSFDALEYELKKRMRLRGRVYEKIGAPPVEKIRTKLPYPMASLNKVKPGTRELYRFLEEYGGIAGGMPLAIAWSLKLDGVSGMVVYKKGKIAGIYTMGDGVIGGNVTYLKDYIKIPKTVSIKQEYVVRGEFIVSKEIWKNKYKDSYSNARSFVSGKINSGYASPALPDIEFVAYQIMKGSFKKLPKPSQAFKLMELEGFTVVENGICESPNIFDLMCLYRKKRKSATYYIDGLVLTSDLPRFFVETREAINPINSVAFKMRLEEQTRQTKIINVDWNISRYGRYVPVAIYEAVYVDGIRMHRATAHNAAHIRDWNMGRGTEITVVRSGDVIPAITDVNVDKSIKPIFPTPYEKGGYEWHWERSDIILDDIEDNREVQIKRATYFYETIGVPRLREGTVTKFWEAGYKTPESIAKASIPDMVKIRGIGEKTATLFDTKIREVMRTVPIDRFLVASTTLKVGIGRKLVKQLFRHCPNVFTMNEDEIKKELVKKKIKGFGPKRIANVAENMPKFRKYLYSFAKKEIKESLKYHEERRKALKRRGYNIKIQNKTFVLTGFIGKIDYELEDYIYENQGDFGSAVTSKTTAVISGNIANITPKMENAYTLGISVLSIEEFSKSFNVPLKRYGNIHS